MAIGLSIYIATILIWGVLFTLLHDDGCPVWRWIGATSVGDEPVRL